ncbi:MAG: hypothetical protein ACTSVV_09160 [Promethearchaeota archaeon]
MNLFYKVLNLIAKFEINYTKNLATILGISDDFLKLIIQSLIDKGYLKVINIGDCNENFSFKCKFCPFSKDCQENAPKIYVISKKGKEILKK